MLIRNLVDLERFVRGLPAARIFQFKCQRLVRKVLLFYWIVVLVMRHYYSFFLQSFRLKIGHLSAKPQGTIVCLSIDENLFLFGLRSLNMSRNPRNRAAKILLMLAPPDVLINRCSGKPHSLLRVLKMRIEKFNYQINIRNDAARNFRISLAQAESPDRPD